MAEANFDMDITGISDDEAEVFSQMCIQEMAEHEDIMNSAVYNFQDTTVLMKKQQSSHEESDHDKPVKLPE